MRKSRLQFEPDFCGDSEKRLGFAWSTSKLDAAENDSSIGKKIPAR
jgi:hypothetical protein